MATKQKPKTKQRSSTTASIVFGSHFQQVKRAAKSGGESVAGYVRRVVIASLKSEA